MIWECRLKPATLEKTLAFLLERLEGWAVVFTIITVVFTAGDCIENFIFIQVKIVLIWRKAQNH